MSQNKKYAVNYKRLLFVALLFVGLPAAAVFGWRFINNQGWYGKKASSTQFIEASAEQMAVLSSAPPNYQETVPMKPLPLEEKTDLPGPTWSFAQIAWQGENALLGANGGKETAKGSFMEEAGIKLVLNRVDDYKDHYGLWKEFVQAYKANPNTTQGAQFLIFMGDAAPWYMQSLENICQEVDPSYHPEIFTICGASNGEDGIYGPPTWIDNFQEMRGCLMAAVPMDGDQNLALSIAAYNGIPVNPDPETYDPDAINFYEVGDFLKAVDAFMAGTVVRRAEVKNGKRTGRMVDVKIDSYATWTPGDARLVEMYRGTEPIARVYSTAENQQQMLTTIVGLNVHLAANSSKIVRMISAIDEAANQMKTYDRALRQYCVYASEVFAGGGDEAYHSPQWWYDMYKGTDTLFNGTLLKLGGSRALNMEEAAEAFGINGGSGYYKDVYQFFCQQYLNLYPGDMESECLDVNMVFNGKYLREAIRSKGSSLAEASKVTYTSGAPTATYGSADYAVTFAHNSDQITPEGEAVLRQAYGSIASTQGVRLSLYGHTDAAGNDNYNLRLSDQRAKAVQQWFMRNYPTQFPPERFAEVAGKGESQPIASNDTEAGRAQNRRVVIQIVQ